MILKFEVSSKEAGMTLLAFLRDNIEEAPSVKSLKRAVESKRCKVNGRVEYFSTHILKRGDRIEIDISDLETKTTQNILVLYEDEELLICDKPPGVVSEDKVFNAYFKAYRGKLHLAHRLDKETSGVIILAKTVPMQEKMRDLFAQREMQKSYLALVDGVVKRPEGKIESFLTKKHSYQGQAIYGSSPIGKGRKAITYWKCLKQGEKASLLLCEPETGRTHQLRAHLSEMGHAILGDYQYAKRFKCPYPAKRHLLHAYSIRFIHPTTNLEIFVKTEPPGDFLEALETI